MSALALQASKMFHDKKKKTIYYDNAVIKVYDLPIFLFAKIVSSRPNCKTKVWFFATFFFGPKNLGPGFETPYYWDLAWIKILL